MSKKITDFYKGSSKDESSKKGIGKSTIKQEIVETSNSYPKVNSNSVKLRQNEENFDNSIKKSSFIHKNGENLESDLNKAHHDGIKNEPEAEFVIEISAKFHDPTTSLVNLIQNSSKISKNSKKSSKFSQKVLSTPKIVTKRTKIDLNNNNECKFCGKKFLDKGYISDHVKRVHSNEIKNFVLKCSLCSSTFFIKKYLNNHMQIKHPNGQTKIFTCDLDGKTFKKRDRLRQHMRSHQQKINCKICNIQLKSFSLWNHMRTHRTEKEFLCNICNKEFRDRASLKEHMDIHDKRFECYTCSKKYANKKSLDRHQKHFHEQLKTETCEICGKQFADKPNLKQHLPTHDENRPKPYKCERCGHEATTNQRYKKHLKSHERQDKRIAAMTNPKKCDQCPALCRDNFALYVHKRNAHTLNIHQCDMCGKYCKNRASLMGHMHYFHIKKR